MSRRRARVALSLALLAAVVSPFDPATFAAAATAVRGARPKEGVEAARRAATSDAPILAGAASRPITPVLGGGAAAVTLAGFAEGRLAAEVRDDLYARSLVIDAGGVAVAIVVLDLYALRRGDVERLRQEARRRVGGHGLAGVLVAATRNHAGPDMTGQFTGPAETIDTAAVGRIVDQAADAVEAAWRARRPARLSFAAARLPRLLTDDRRPLRLDDRALLVRFESVEGRLGIASLAAFSASPEILGRDGRAISADYPGAACRALESSFGGVGMVLVGASGGRMLPASDDLEAYGAALARALVVAWSGRGEGPAPLPDDVERGTLGLGMRTLEVPLDNAALREAFTAGRRRGAPTAGSGLSTEVSLLTLAAGGAPVLNLACVPGAPYPETINGGIENPQDAAADLPGAPREPALRDLLPAPIKMVAGACGDDLGDLLPASQWDQQAPFAYGLPAAQRGEEASPGPRTVGLLWRAFADLGAGLR